MTIKLAYIKERDGLVFLVDKEGKELGQVVPKDSTFSMNYAGVDLVEKNPGIGVHRIYDAMLSAAKVDVSAALVKVPERMDIDPREEKKEAGRLKRGWNAYADALEEK
jgi:hypothetical protein